jgi:hypothetical protein
MLYFTGCLSYAEKQAIARVYKGVFFPELLDPNLVAGVDDAMIG